MKSMLPFLLAMSLAACAEDPINIGSRRDLFVDNFLTMNHRPQFTLSFRSLWRRDQHNEYFRELGQRAEITSERRSFNLARRPKVGSTILSSAC